MTRYDVQTITAIGTPGANGIGIVGGNSAVNTPSLDTYAEWNPTANPGWPGGTNTGLKFGFGTIPWPTDRDFIVSIHALATSIGESGGVPLSPWQFPPNPAYNIDNRSIGGGLTDAANHSCALRLTLQLHSDSANQPSYCVGSDIHAQSRGWHGQFGSPFDETTEMFTGGNGGFVNGYYFYYRIYELWLEVTELGEDSSGSRSEPLDLFTTGFFGETVEPGRGVTPPAPFYGPPVTVSGIDARENGIDAMPVVAWRDGTVLQAFSYDVGGVALSGKGAMDSKRNYITSEGLANYGNGIALIEDRVRNTALVIFDRFDDDGTGLVFLGADPTPFTRDAGQYTRALSSLEFQMFAAFTATVELRDHGTGETLPAPFWTGTIGPTNTYITDPAVLAQAAAALAVLDDPDTNESRLEITVTSRSASGSFYLIAYPENYDPDRGNIYVTEVGPSGAVIRDQEVVSTYYYDERNGELDYLYLPQTGGVWGRVLTFGTDDDGNTVNGPGYFESLQTMDLDTGERAMLGSRDNPDGYPFDNLLSSNPTDFMGPGPVDLGGSWNAFPNCMYVDPRDGTYWFTIEYQHYLEANWTDLYGEGGSYSAEVAVVHTDRDGNRLDCFIFMADGDGDNILNSPKTLLVTKEGMVYVTMTMDTISVEGDLDSYDEWDGVWAFDPAADYPLDANGNGNKLVTVNPWEGNYAFPTGIWNTGTWIHQAMPAMTPPLRLKQRDDELGPDEGHARLHTRQEGGNSASSLQFGHRIPDRPENGNHYV